MDIVISYGESNIFVFSHYFNPCPLFSAQIARICPPPLKKSRILRLSDKLISISEKLSLMPTAKDMATGHIIIACPPPPHTHTHTLSNLNLPT